MKALIRREIVFFNINVSVGVLFMTLSIGDKIKISPIILPTGGFQREGNITQRCSY